MEQLLGMMGGEYAAAGSLLAALIPGIVLVCDMWRDEARIVRVREKRDGRAAD